MKVKISDWAWLPLEEFSTQKLVRLKDRLTVHPRKTSVHQDVPPEPIELFKVKDDLIGVPRSFFVQQNKLSEREHEVIVETSSGRPVDLKFKGELKEDQKQCLACVLNDRGSGSFGGIVQAKPGWGKTVAGLAVWSAFNTSAIVLVQKQFLVDQWIERIGEFMPGARVGRIQQDKCEYGEDFDISVGMLQTIVSRADSYPEDLWHAFGLQLTDETHRVGAPTWSQVVPSFTAGYRLGLSATPRRKDGADDVFLQHIGPIIFRSKVNMVTPRVRRIFTGFVAVKTRTFELDKMSKQIQIQHICKSPDRNRLIVKEIGGAVGAGRKVMVLSERRKHLELLKEKFDAGKKAECVTDFYVGGMKQEELDEAAKADVLFCTYQMTKEALDIPALDTVFLTTPVSDVEQAVGRIMRVYEGKKQPIITDFIDESLSRFAKLWNTRRLFYVKEGMFEAKK